MKLAIIGSRNISNIDIEKYIPTGVTEIVSGGAKGVDSLAKKCAIEHNIKYTEILPDYPRYKKGESVNFIHDDIRKAKRFEVDWLNKHLVYKIDRDISINIDSVLY